MSFRGCLTIQAKAIYINTKENVMGSSLEKIRVLVSLMDEMTSDSIVIKEYHRAGIDDFEGGEIIFANATKAAHYNLNTREICGKTDAKLMLPEEAAKALKSDLWVLRNKKPLEDQRDTVTRKDGTVVILSVTKTLIKSSDNKVFYVCCIARDVTNHEKEHAASEDWKKYISENILIPLLALRHDFPNIGVGHELEMLVLNIQKKLTEK